MCIYFVKQYQCGHYADALGPTLLSHCREYDTCLRYWHDQVFYQPLEATYAEYGTIQMPEPCRPIWPIPFPGNAYLPIPTIGRYPRGLARPRDTDVEIPDADLEEIETPTERISRENDLIRSLGSFQNVASHRELQHQLSILEETRAYEALYPNHPRALSTRLLSNPWSRNANINTAPLHPPPYPLAHIIAILTFTRARSLPNQPPNVIITPHTTPRGCLRTLQQICLYNPTTTTALQCPWLLATRIPFHYPLHPINAPPAPRYEAALLADFETRGGARSKHMDRDPAGSEIIKVAPLREGCGVGFIDPVVYLALYEGVPGGPWERDVPPPVAVAMPGRNVFAEEFVPGRAMVEESEAVGWVEEEEEEEEGFEVGEEPMYRHVAGGGEVDWVSEGGGQEEGEGVMGRWVRRYVRSEGGR